MKTTSGHPRLKKAIFAVILCCIVLAVGLQFISAHLNQKMRSEINAAETYGEPCTDGNILSLLQSDDAVQFVLHDSPEPICPSVTLDPSDRSFQFSWSALSSYLAMGKYTLKDGVLTLCDESKDTYVFTLRDGTFVFDEKKSSPIPEYRYGEGKDPECPVKDGAVFRLKPSDGR